MKRLGENSVFTLATFNKSTPNENGEKKDTQTACHTDNGNSENAWQCFAVLGKNIEGGHLVFPEYKFALKIDAGDVIIMKGQRDMHGNTPLTAGKKLSAICYIHKKHEGKDKNTRAHLLLAKSSKRKKTESADQKEAPAAKIQKTEEEENTIGQQQELTTSQKTEQNCKEKLHSLLNKIYPVYTEALGSTDDIDSEERYKKLLENLENMIRNEKQQ